MVFGNIFLFIQPSNELSLEHYLEEAYISKETYSSLSLSLNPPLSISYFLSPTSPPSFYLNQFMRKTA